MTYTILTNRLCRMLPWLVLPVILFVSQPAEARRVALVIGNSGYADAPLRNPVNDAADMSARLRQLGFQVTTLTDRNRAQMAQAVRDFGLTAQGADAALFYFAGHGVQVRGRNFLLPIGQTFKTEAEVETEGIDVNSVLARLEEAGAKVSLLILDACRNNPLTRIGRSSARGLARMEAPSGALVAFAAQPGAEAEDGTGRNGTYTHHLLEHIGTPGLTVEQMFKRVRAGVERDTGRRQSPREESSLTAEFSFASTPVVSAPNTSVSPGPASIEDEAWALCRNGRTEVPCQDYLSEWPQGRFASLARTKIRDYLAAQPQTAKTDSPTNSAQAAPTPTATPSPQASQAAADPQATVTLAPGGRWLVPGREFIDCEGCPVMVVMPAGWFSMGSAPDEGWEDERPQRQVSVARFAIGKYEVTQAQWRMLMQTNPSGSARCSDICPVEGVSWDDAQQYTMRLSARLGNAGYRLPSEAEWEYACRDDQGGAFCGGSNAEALAWTADNSDSRPRPVGGKAGNAWGLHDMSGNVWEWVQDCYNEDAYKSKAPTDGSAYEPGRRCPARVRRGGSWDSDFSWARAAIRIPGAPNLRDSTVGFRVARTLP